MGGGGGCGGGGGTDTQQLALTYRRLSPAARAQRTAENSFNAPVVAVAEVRGADHQVVARHPAHRDPSARARGQGFGVDARALRVFSTSCAKSRAPRCPARPELVGLSRRWFQHRGQQLRGCGRCPLTETAGAAGAALIAETEDSHPVPL
ncbi:hypothetical protein AOLI_G00256470 [Acnodon oligacanthus]